MLVESLRLFLFKNFMLLSDFAFSARMVGNTTFMICIQGLNLFSFYCIYFRFFFVSNTFFQLSNVKQCYETRLLSNCREISANKFEIPFFMGLQFWIINSDQFGSFYKTFEDHLNVLGPLLSTMKQQITIKDHMLPLLTLWNWQLAVKYKSYYMVFAQYKLTNQCEYSFNCLLENITWAVFHLQGE